MPAPIGTAISTVNQVTFGHYPITFFHIKILPFMQFIRKAVAVAKNTVENSHRPIFFQNYTLSLEAISEKWDLKKII
jgi:hypothetical protein